MREKQVGFVRFDSDTLADHRNACAGLAGSLPNHRPRAFSRATH